MGLDHVEGCHSRGLLPGLIPEFGRASLFAKDVVNAGVSSFVLGKNGAIKMAPEEVEIFDLSETPTREGPSVN